MTLRIGLLGASRIAPKAVIDPARGRDDVAITAVAARDLGKAQAYAAEHAIAHAVEGYGALFPLDLDVLYNALPPKEHLDWVITGSHQGFGQLVEKPFALNAREATAMVGEALEARTELLEAFHYRFHPAFLTLQRWVAQGRLGRIRRASAVFDAEIAERPGELRWIRPLGGGALMDLGCYALHALRTLLACEPQVVEARCEVRSGVDAATHARLAFGDIEAELACDMTRPRQALLVLEGDRGRAEFDNYVSPHAFGRLAFTAADGAVEEVPLDPRSTYAFQLDHLVEVCAGRAAPLTGGRDAIAQMRAIDAIYTAAGLGPIGG